MHVVALLTQDGTACSETALFDADDTPENRRAMEDRVSRDNHDPDRPVPGTWADVSDNDAIILAAEEA
jgi:hypothetical protein